MNEVLSLVISHGARLARVGEFTERAFLNGRIDLSQAEAVMDLISSENEFSRSNSISQIKGSVRDKIDGMREKIIHEAAFIEAALDDPENYQIDDYYKDTLSSLIDEISDEIRSLLKDAESVRYLRNGIDTVIAGRPNVGKSSLMNLFAGYEKAIVTSLPGTTRDILEEKISIDGLILNLIDTAGLHDTIDEVESIGIERARTEMKKADLVLYVIDSSDYLKEDDEIFMKDMIGSSCIIILNKTDLGCRIDPDHLKDISKAPVVEISVKEETGIDELKEMIKDLFCKDMIKDSRRVYITNKRQTEKLKDALSSLEEVMQSVKNGMTEDTFTIDMMDAYHSLGSIIGEDVSDDLADRIFSEFCMGK